MLVDFEHSVLHRHDYEESSGAVGSSGHVKLPEPDRTPPSLGLGDRIRLGVFGSNLVAPKKSVDLLRSLKSRAERPRLLIVGGGSPGEGTDTFHDDGSVEIVAISVFPSRQASLLADAQQLPFADDVFDGVWIQATLEHALEPHKVIEQVHRVLKPDGVVYAENLFIMGVHEGARDFVRYTQSGHRWLFRNFEPIDIGPLGGAGYALLWSIRYFWRAFGLSDKIVTLLAAPFFWLRHCDRFMRRRDSADAAIGFYFMGRKAGAAIGPQDIIAYYDAP